MSEPTLWHIPISHYSEKARWALAHKAIEHERRAPVPGAHFLIALWLTRGSQNTFPVLELDGRTIGDSTAIIAALEQYRPEPALYPADPAQRRRALELEEWFDERLGPPIRLLVWHEMRSDRERMARLSQSMLPAPVRRIGPAKAVAGRFGSTWVQVRFRVSSDEAAEQARSDVISALDRLEAELEASGSGYLVGDSFSVADLTAASLFYPVALPPEGPQGIPELPEAYERFRAPLLERPGVEWVREMYRRHRKPADSAAAAAAAA